MAVKRPTRQAVVLIHGIGEQMPMGTLRPFVKAVADFKGEGAPYYSKPDAMSESFELRKLQSRSAPPTDFYEYYWAYNVEGTSLWDVVMWVLRLISRPYRDIPEGLRGLWVISRLLVVSAILLMVVGGVGACSDWSAQWPKFGVFWLVSTLIVAALQFVLVSYLGDAARYLSPRPHNIKLRHKIRSEGIKLLKALNESGRYDRIILVGHSLGSVVGYDLLTHLWQAYHEQLPAIETDPEVQQFIRERLHSHTTPQPTLRDELSVVGEKAAVKWDPSVVADFQECQKKAWCEQRYFGNGWRITDFVTMGSPLAHAMLLLAQSAGDFIDRKAERELITCPPIRDNKSYAFGRKVPMVLNLPNTGTVAQPAVAEGGQPEAMPAVKTASAMRYNPLILHHAAPFAVTRWTNLYFPAHLGICGDIVGGRLAPMFGNGINDIAVTSRHMWGLAKYSLLAHTSYWLSCDGAAPAAREGPLPALYALRQALALRELPSFNIKPPTPAEKASAPATSP